MHVPGTDVLRVSVLSAWADMLTGLLTGTSVAPRVPVTLDLSIDLPAPVRGTPSIVGASRILKAGRSVVVLEVTFVEEGRTEPIAVGTAAFMPSPDTSLTLPALKDSPSLLDRPTDRLTAPFAERAGCERRDVGVAELPRREDALNASNTINGGLIALLVEEAALSSAPRAVLSSPAPRHLRPARGRPPLATPPPPRRPGGLAAPDARAAG